jgi:hypothetical protein
MRSHCAICFAVCVWRDHTKWCACYFNVGKSREITLNGVLAVLLMKSNEISPSGVLAVFMLGSPERSRRVVC